MARKFITSGSPWEKIAGYSRAVADGRWVFVSGTMGFDLKKGKLARGVKAQTEAALDIIFRALRSARSKPEDVVRVRVYVPRRSDVRAVSEIVKRRLGPAGAANTTVCSPLAVAGARVEIEVTAVRAAVSESRLIVRARRRKT
jgi:enamine deaminase RidA (YjgF/YER057c/UK114 family)